MNVKWNIWENERKNKIYLDLMILIIISMILIPSYKVEAKTLGQLKNELAELERKYKENENKKELTENEIKTVNNEISSSTNFCNIFSIISV